MHVAALVEAPNHVCCRYRFAPFRKPLAEAGHRLSLVPFPKSIWRRLLLGSDLTHFDAVIIQRRLLPWWQLRALRHRIRYLLFDLDDAVYLRDSYHPRGSQDVGKLRRFAALCRCADAVVAGNAFLAEMALQQGATSVHVIPTCVDASRYNIAVPHRQHEVELVWIGSSSTIKGLKQITPILEHVGQSCRGARLKLICDSFFHLEHLPIVEAPWSETTEAHELAGADIGIAWVPDDDWSRGKCGLKVLQYMAAGLPVIANPVGVHTTMVRHGETGFLASTAEEWAEAVTTLQADANLRRRMGWAARRRVEQEFSINTGASLWRGILDELQRRGTRRKTG